MLFRLLLALATMHRLDSNIKYTYYFALFLFLTIFENTDGECLQCARQSEVNVGCGGSNQGVCMPKTLVTTNPECPTTPTAGVTSLGGKTFEQVFNQDFNNVDFECRQVCDGTGQQDTGQCSGPHACNVLSCEMARASSDTAGATEVRACPVSISNMELASLTTTESMDAVTLKRQVSCQSCSQCGQYDGIRDSYEGKNGKDYGLGCARECSVQLCQTGKVYHFMQKQCVECSHITDTRLCPTDDQNAFQQRGGRFTGLIPMVYFPFCQPKSLLNGNFPSYGSCRTCTSNTVCKSNEYQARCGTCAVCSSKRALFVKTITDGYLDVYYKEHTIPCQISECKDKTMTGLANDGSLCITRCAEAACAIDEEFQECGLPHNTRCVKMHEPFSWPATQIIGMIPHSSNLLETGDVKAFSRFASFENALVDLISGSDEHRFQCVFNAAVITDSVHKPGGISSFFYPEEMTQSETIASRGTRHCRYNDRTNDVVPPLIPLQNIVTKTSQEFSFYRRVLINTPARACSFFYTGKSTVEDVSSFEPKQPNEIKDHGEIYLALDMYNTESAKVSVFAPDDRADYDAPRYTFSALLRDDGNNFSSFEVSFHQSTGETISTQATTFASSPVANSNLCVCIDEPEQPAKLTCDCPEITVTNFTYSPFLISDISDETYDYTVDESTDYFQWNGNNILYNAWIYSGLFLTHNPTQTSPKWKVISRNFRWEWDDPHPLKQYYKLNTILFYNSSLGRNLIIATPSTFVYRTLQETPSLVFSKADFFVATKPIRPVSWNTMQLISGNSPDAKHIDADVANGQRYASYMLLFYLAHIYGRLDNMKFAPVENIINRAWMDNFTLPSFALTGMTGRRQNNHECALLLWSTREAVCVYNSNFSNIGNNHSKYYKHIHTIASDQPHEIASVVDIDFDGTTFVWIAIRKWKSNIAKITWGTANQEIITSEFCVQTNILSDTFTPLSRQALGQNDILSATSDNKEMFVLEYNEFRMYVVKYDLSTTGFLHTSIRSQELKLMKIIHTPQEIGNKLCKISVSRKIIMLAAVFPDTSNGDLMNMTIILLDRNNLQITHEMSINIWQKNVYSVISVVWVKEDTQAVIGWNGIIHEMMCNKTICKLQTTKHYSSVQNKHFAQIQFVPHTEDFSEGRALATFATNAQQESLNVLSEQCPSGYSQKITQFSQHTCTGNQLDEDSNNIQEPCLDLCKDARIIETFMTCDGSRDCTDFCDELLAEEALVTSWLQRRDAEFLQCSTSRTDSIETCAFLCSSSMLCKSFYWKKIQSEGICFLTQIDTNIGNASSLHCLRQTANVMIHSSAKTKIAHAHTLEFLSITDFVHSSYLPPVVVGYAFIHTDQSILLNDARNDFNKKPTFDIVELPSFNHPSSQTPFLMWPADIGTHRPDLGIGFSRDWVVTMNLIFEYMHGNTTFNPVVVQKDSKTFVAPVYVENDLTDPALMLQNKVVVTLPRNKNTVLVFNVSCPGQLTIGSETVPCADDKYLILYDGASRFSVSSIVLTKDGWTHIQYDFPEIVLQGLATLEYHQKFSSRTNASLTQILQGERVECEWHVKDFPLADSGSFIGAVSAQGADDLLPDLECVPVMSDSNVHNLTSNWQRISFVLDSVLARQRFDLTISHTNNLNTNLRSTVMLDDIQLNSVYTYYPVALLHGYGKIASLNLTTSNFELESYAFLVAQILPNITSSIANDCAYDVFLTTTSGIASLLTMFDSEFNESLVRENALSDLGCNNVSFERPYCSFWAPINLSNLHLVVTPTGYSILDTWLHDDRDSYLIPLLGAYDAPEYLQYREQREKRMRCNKALHDVYVSKPPGTAIRACTEPDHYMSRTTGSCEPCALPLNMTYPCETGKQIEGCDRLHYDNPNCVQCDGDAAEDVADGRAVFTRACDIRCEPGFFTNERGRCVSCSTELTCKPGEYQVPCSQGRNTYCAPCASSAEYHELGPFAEQVKYVVDPPTIGRVACMPVRENTEFNRQCKTGYEWNFEGGKYTVFEGDNEDRWQIKEDQSTDSGTLTVPSTTTTTDLTACIQICKANEACVGLTHIYWVQQGQAIEYGFRQCKIFLDNMPLNFNTQGLACQIQGVPSATSTSLAQVSLDHALDGPHVANDCQLLPRTYTQCDIQSKFNRACKTDFIWKRSATFDTTVCYRQLTASILSFETNPSSPNFTVSHSSNSCTDFHAVDVPASRENCVKLCQDHIDCKQVHYTETIVVPLSSPMKIYDCVLVFHTIELFDGGLVCEASVQAENVQEQSTLSLAQVSHAYALDNEHVTENCRTFNETLTCAATCAPGYFRSAPRTCSACRSAQAALEVLDAGESFVRFTPCTAVSDVTAEVCPPVANGQLVANGPSPAPATSGPITTADTVSCPVVCDPGYYPADETSVVNITNPSLAESPSEPLVYESTLTVNTTLHTQTCQQCAHQPAIQALFDSGAASYDPTPANPCNFECIHPYIAIGGTCLDCSLCADGEYARSDDSCNCHACDPDLLQEHYAWASAGALDDPASCAVQCGPGYYDKHALGVCAPWSESPLSPDECKAEHWFRDASPFHDYACLPCKKCTGQRTVTPCTATSDAECEPCGVPPIGGFFAGDNCSPACRSGHELSPALDDDPAACVPCPPCSVGSFLQANTIDCTCTPCQDKPPDSEWVSSSVKTGTQACAWVCRPGFAPDGNGDCKALEDPDARIANMASARLTRTVRCEPGYTLNEDYECEPCQVKTPPENLKSSVWNWNTLGSPCSWTCSDGLFRHANPSLPDYIACVTEEQLVNDALVSADEVSRTSLAHVIMPTIWINAFAIFFLIMLT